MTIKKQLCLILLTIPINGLLFSQQNTVATGGEASGTGGTVSFTIGQIDFSAQSGANGTVTQGIQQPLEFYNVGLEEAVNNFSVLFFPNPTVAELQVELKNVSLDQLTYVLTDLNGKIIEFRSIDTENLTINMTELSRTNYFLNFVRKGNVEGSYQIVKN